MSKLVRISAGFVILHCINGDFRIFSVQFSVIMQPGNGWNGETRGIAKEYNHTLKVSDILILRSMEDLRANYKKIKHRRKVWRLY